MNCVHMFVVSFMMLVYCVNFFLKFLVLCFRQLVSLCHRHFQNLLSFNANGKLTFNILHSWDVIVRHIKADKVIEKFKCYRNIVKIDKLQVSCVVMRRWEITFKGDYFQ